MAPPVSPVSTDSSGRRPGRIGSWVGALLLVLAVVVGVGGVALGLASLGDTVDDLQRVPVRTGGSFDFAEAGDYPVYLERYGIDDPDALPFDDPEGAVVLVRETARLEIRPGSTDVTYDVDGHTGRRLGTFVVEVPGRYELRGSNAGRYADILAVGQGDPDEGVAPIGLGVLGGLGLGGAGVVLLAVSSVQRRRSRRLASHPGGPPPGWGAPSWGAPVPSQWGASPGGSPWGGPAAPQWGAPGTPPPLPRPPGPAGWAPPTAPPPPPAPGSSSSWPPSPPSEGPVS